MGLRPGKCYRSKKDRAYSRTAKLVQRKNYINAPPGIKIRQFNMGNTTKKFSHILDLVTDSHVQVRDNALESARIAINRFLLNKLGKEGYFMRIRVFPHQILRENKQAQGAHADRIQKGMSHPFGKSIGRAARVSPGTILMSVLVDEANIQLAKKALLRAKSRIPGDMHVKVGTDVESIGTRPRHLEEIAIEVLTGAKKAEAEGEKKAAGKPGEKKAEEEGGEKEGKAGESKGGIGTAGSDKGKEAGKGKAGAGEKEAGKGKGAEKGKGEEKGKGK